MAAKAATCSCCGKSVTAEEVEVGTDLNCGRCETPAKEGDGKGKKAAERKPTPSKA
jgi:hypothetical protein